MKKLLAIIISLALVFTLAACAEESKEHLSYDEVAKAALDTNVCIEANVQAHQSWWENNGKGVVSVYLQDKDGGYFAYNLACSKEDADKLTTGTKIRITGVKAEWAGEVEIIDATFEFVKNGKKFVAKATDVTSKLGTTEIDNYKNQLVAVKNAEVTKAALYKWDGSGSQGDDLYYEVKVGDNTYTFVVESYLCDKDTAVYKAVEGLKVGDKINIEGFAYWYNGIQLHTTKVTK